MILTKKIQYHLIFYFILLKPFYLWERGLPQIADFLFLIFILGSSWKFRVKKSTIESSIIYFMFYIAIINLIFCIIFPDSARGFFFSISYILFLGLGAIKIKQELYLYPDFIDCLYRGCKYTTIIQFALLLILPQTTDRATLFFSEPNQMGYYFLCIMTLLTLTSPKKNKKEMIILFLVLLMNVFLIIFSQSRAAIAAIVILLIAFFNKNKLLHPKKVWAVIILLGTLFLLNENYFPERYKLSGIVRNRFESAMNKDDNGLSGRGYDRIYLYPQYLVFGSGEGGYSRYDHPSIHHHDEIHSLVGTLLFSYGFVGAILFLRIFNKFFKKENFSSLLFIIPIIFYNLTHIGIRSQFFWILIVVIHYEIEFFEKNKILKNEL